MAALTFWGLERRRDQGRRSGLSRRLDGDVACRKRRARPDCERVQLFNRLSGILGASDPGSVAHVVLAAEESGEALLLRPVVLFLSCRGVILPPPRSFQFACHTIGRRSFDNPCVPQQIGPQGSPLLDEFPDVRGIHRDDGGGEPDTLLLLVQCLPGSVGDALNCVWRGIDENGDVEIAAAGVLSPGNASEQPDRRNPVILGRVLNGGQDGVEACAFGGEQAFQRRSEGMDRFQPVQPGAAVTQDFNDAGLLKVVEHAPGAVGCHAGVGGQTGDGEGAAVGRQRSEDTHASGPGQDGVQGVVNE